MQVGPVNNIVSTAKMCQIVTEQSYWVRIAFLSKDSFRLLGEGNENGEIETHVVKSGDGETETASS